MDTDKEWYVNIGPEGSGYRITINRYGFCLLVDRGIPCETPVQAATTYSSTATIEEVEYVVNKYSEEYFNSISKFVEFLSTLPKKVQENPSQNLSMDYNLTIDWITKENMVSIFFHTLIRNIVEMAEFYAIKKTKPFS